MSAGRVNIADIQKLVRGEWDLPRDAMFTKARARDIARPRQVAMYLCRKHTDASFPSIGLRFGGRDHTTVLHAVRKVGELMKRYPKFAARVQRLDDDLASRKPVEPDPFTVSVYRAQQQASEAGRM